MIDWLTFIPEGWHLCRVIGYTCRWSCSVNFCTWLSLSLSVYVFVATDWLTCNVSLRVSMSINRSSSSSTCLFLQDPTGYIEAISSTQVCRQHPYLTRTGSILLAENVSAVVDCYGVYTLNLHKHTIIMVSVLWTCQCIVRQVYV